MQKNVLLITIDSLRADYFRSTKVPDPVLPNIEELAKSGDVFEHAFATGPGTTPSFPAMITGTLPLSYEGLGPLSDARPRVANNISQNDISTAAFQCNPFLSKHFNYHVGFDRFEDYQNPLMGVATKIFPRGIDINNPKLEWVDDIFSLTDIIKKSYQLVKGKPRPYVSAEVITDDTINWLNKKKDRFFCWTHYMDVHHPCFPPVEYRRKFDVDDVSQSEVSEWYYELLNEPEELSNQDIKNLEKLYSAAIAYVDDQVQRIIECLKNQKIYSETAIIITSDHGELFGDHGMYGKPERMFDELLHVPLVVVNGPEYLEDARDQLISLLDLPPLIHEVLGIDIPTEYEGRLPGMGEPRTHILAEHEVHGDVVIGGRSMDWLYEADEVLDEHRLFDLREDSIQVDSLTEGGEPVRRAVISRLKELDVDARYLQHEMEADIEGRLEDLGYL